MMGVPSSGLLRASATTLMAAGYPRRIVFHRASFGWLSGTPALAHAITNESADELKLAVEQMVYAIIKASSVMVGVD
jgi:hypothetical protein